RSLVPRRPRGHWLSLADSAHWSPRCPSGHQSGATAAPSPRQRLVSRRRLTARRLRAVVSSWCPILRATLGRRPDLFSRLNPGTVDDERGQGPAVPITLVVAGTADRKFNAR